MSIMKWNDAYSVGVEEIDNQHKGLVNNLNELFDAMSIGKANDVLGKILDQLIRYAQIHFALAFILREAQPPLRAVVERNEVRVIAILKVMDRDRCTVRPSGKKNHNFFLSHMT